MQLRRIALTGALSAFLWLPHIPCAHSDDRVDITTTWFQENRKGGLGGVTVIHPMFDVAFDIGEHVEIAAGYAADVVTGATQSVYRRDAASDAVSAATPFEDTRHQGHLQLGISGRRSAIRLGASAGFERDYASIGISAAGSVDLPGKNTNLAISYSHSFDEVCDRENSMVTPRERAALTGTDPCKKSYVFGKDTPGATVWRPISIDTLQGTLTQNLSPTTALQVAVYGQVLTGFQANPYRRVRITSVEAQEHVPQVRGRMALRAQLNRYIPAVRSAVHASLRGYSDTWGVNSATAEIAYSQYLGRRLVAKLRTRVYQQTAARFFKDAYFYETQDTGGEFFTGDRELGPLRHVIAGGKLSLIEESDDEGDVWGFINELKVNIKADLLFLQALAADPLSDNPDGICGQFLGNCQTLDGFVLSAALLISY